MTIISRAVSGPYEWFFGPVGTPITLGVIEDAATIRWQTSDIEIIGDNLGDMIQGLISRGHNCFVDLVFQEPELPAVLEAMWPFIAANNILPGVIGSAAGAGTTADSIGQVRRGAGIAQLKGVAVSGGAFPAATSTTPEFIRANRATLAPNQNLQELFGSRQRVLPLSFLCLPFEDPGGTPGPTASIVGIDDLAA